MAEIQEIDSLVMKYVNPSEMGWIVPLLDALQLLGGEGKPKAVTQAILDKHQAALSPTEWEAVLNNNRIAFVRLRLVNAGLMGGEHGVWRITQDGIKYLESHRTDNLELQAPKKRTVDPAVTLKPVPVTRFEAYHLPVLKALADGLSERRQIVEYIGTTLKTLLLPGDFETMPQGETVWEFRAEWAFSALASEGLAENVSWGKWRITEAGSKHLEQNVTNVWDVAGYQRNSTAKVRVDAPVEGAPVSSAEEPPTESDIQSVLTMWNGLKENLPPTIWKDLTDALRPDLGATLDDKQIFGRNVVLYGPPGTGKTYIAQLIGHALTGMTLDVAGSRCRLVQFHPSYSYEDFVQGLKPDLTKESLRFDRVPGPFMEICEEAANQEDELFVLIIDEINRGDPARIFGELLFALEYRHTTVVLPSGKQFKVPSNLVVIGTMNSVDRSVALVDYALRRRFSFVRIDPMPKVIEDVRSLEKLSPAAVTLLAGFNNWMEKNLGPEYTIGHSFFLKPSIQLEKRDDFDTIWRLNVKPLIEEYFFGNREQISQAEKEWRRLLDDALAEFEPGDN